MIRAGRLRHLRSLEDLGHDGIESVLHRAAAFKAARHVSRSAPRVLDGKSVALIFEKPSTRTRVSFEVAVAELGGHPVVIQSRDSQMDRGEPIEDTARVLSRYVHAIVIRTFADQIVERLAAASRVPVVNALTDGGHPCQVLADLLTVRERFGSVARPRVAWIGDGNNVAFSWIEAALLLGFPITLACPPGYEPRLPSFAPRPGAEVRVVRDPVAAVRGARVVVTDVWASMGQETERARRLQDFAGYSVTPALMAHAAPDAIVMHCLPAHRGEEIDGTYIDAPDSVVWDEAENRLHAQKGLFEWLLAP